MAKAILLTGRPGSGKTTLIRRVLARLPVPAGGFYTEEIREQGVRRGFAIVTLDEQRGVLAHVNLRGGPHIGKYGVDTAALDRLGVPAIEQAMNQGQLVVIDEIGSMELLSRRFCQVVEQLLHSQATVLGTITRRSNPFTDQIREMAGVTIIDVRPDNRDALVERVLDLLEDRHAA